MSDSETLSCESDMETPHVELTERRLNLLVKMLEKYLEWAETLPEIPGEDLPEGL